MRSVSVTAHDPDDALYRLLKRAHAEDRDVRITFEVKTKEGNARCSRVQALADVHMDNSGPDVIVQAAFRGPEVEEVE